VGFTRRTKEPEGCERGISRTRDALAFIRI
jgi:hypothetical protein